MSRFFSLILLINICLSAQEADFYKFFTDSTLRLDYYHTGNADSEEFTTDKVYRYGTWGRSHLNLIENFNNGRYYFKVYDKKSGQLIYSKGFDSYFGEYQTSSQALDGIKKTYHESAIFPYPKDSIKFVIEKRNNEKILSEIYTTSIDPEDVNTIEATTNDESVTIYESYKSGSPSQRVDIVILGEGYTKNESDKFRSDVDKFTGMFFDQEPYKTYKKSFNIYGVLKPSVESGVDEPRAGIFRETTLSATFNSLGSERYLLTEDNKTIRDLAAFVPYDAIYIMVNHSRYGGGGIYNLFCTFTSDAQFGKYLFIHEFGHSFAGLADEYYTSSTAYNDFYPRGIEPVEPNITALLDPANIKWKHLLSEGIEIPTPWEKAKFDKADIKWQKNRAKMNDMIAELKKKKASQDEIDKAEKLYAKKDKEHSEMVDKFLESSIYWGKVGAYEGAGYSAEGLYRPMLDCIMFSKGDKPFCKICEEAIIKVINHYSN